MSRGADRPRLPPKTLLAYGLVRALVATYRRRPVTGEQHLAGLMTRERPAILAFWHNRLLLCGDYVLGLARRGVRLAALVSRSRDGEATAPLARRFGVTLVRGSSFTGGTLGLRRLYREIAGHGRTAVTTPDGSRGPVYRARPGTVVLAQLTGAPIVPLAYAADRAWRLRSWDRFLVPKPFARVALAIGPPMAVPRQLDDAELAGQCEELGRRLDAALEAAEAALTA